MTSPATPSHAACSGCCAFGVDAEIRIPPTGVLRWESLPGARRGQAEALQVLTERGARPRFRPAERPPLRVVRRACCRASIPARRAAGRRLAERTARPSSGDQDGLTRGRGVPRDARAVDRARRGRFAIAYAKGAEAVIDVLAEAEASNAVLTLDEHAVLAATRAQAKTVWRTRIRRTSSSRPRHARTGDGRADSRPPRCFRRLRPDLRELAELRLEHPSLSLRELALKCRPPLPKPPDIGVCASCRN